MEIKYQKHNISSYTVIYIFIFYEEACGQIKLLRGRPQNSTHSLLIILILFIE